MKTINEIQKIIVTRKIETMKVKDKQTYRLKQTCYIYMNMYYDLIKKITKLINNTDVYRCNLII